MAFEDFTTRLLARAAEVHDPGSADAYLRLTVAAEATLKLTGICLLSEAVYRYGSEPAKKIIADTIAGRSAGWGPVFEVAARLPADCDLARRITAEPSVADRVHELWSAIRELLTTELEAVISGVTKRKSFAWRHVLGFLPVVRNKVKGHGAPPTRLYAALNPLLRELVEHALADLVGPIPAALAFVRRTRDEQGLFLGLGSPTKEAELPVEVPTLTAGDMILAAPGGQIPLVPLISFDERTRALLVFNDSVSDLTGELEYIDYLQGQFARRPGEFVKRHGFAELPASETSAAPVLRSEPGVTVPNNLPERRRTHVTRTGLEAELTRYLLDDKHRIVSLDGRGGIGKTYLATEVCQRIAVDPSAGGRFGFMLWMSARDVDLTAAGPKPVRQDLVTLEDALRFILRAYDPSASVEKLTGQELRAAFTEACTALHPLLVFDNFETFADPEKLHRELDELAPHLTKILITSRHRDYRGDFPIAVGGMSEAESRELILHEARARYVHASFESPDRVRRVYEAAQGHAYTMRLIVAQVGKGVTVHDACTAAEKSTNVLSALFERSLRLAEPADVELLAILGAFRVECPEEALYLLPLPRDEVRDALGRLLNLSLIERIDEPLLRYPQYVCPRAAGEYLRHKRLLESPDARARIEELVAGLRANTQRIRMMASQIPFGVHSPLLSADVMMSVARWAMTAEQPDVARRAVEVALEHGGEDSGLVGDAAILLQKAGSAPAEVDGMFEWALGLDPTNASTWMDWGRFKAETRAPAGQVMTCYERALEANPRSAGAAVEFASSVLEVVKQERKLGAGAVRVNDRRPARSLLAKAKSALRELLDRRDAKPGVRLATLLAQGRILLELDGPSEQLRGLLREAETLGPKHAQVRALAEAMKKAEAGG